MSTNEFEAVTDRVAHSTTGINCQGGRAAARAPRGSTPGGGQGLTTQPPTMKILIVYRDPSGGSRATVDSPGRNLIGSATATRREFGPTDLVMGAKFDIEIQRRGEASLTLTVEALPSSGSDSDGPVVIVVRGDGDVEPEPTPSSSEPTVTYGDLKLTAVGESSNPQRTLTTLEIVRGHSSFMASNDAHHETDVRRSTSDAVVIEVRKKGVETEPT